MDSVAFGVMDLQGEIYKYNNFPESYSGFYAIRNNQLVELTTGYECNGSSRGIMSAFEMIAQAKEEDRYQRLVFME